MSSGEGGEAGGLHRLLGGAEGFGRGLLSGLGGVQRRLALVDLGLEFGQARALGQPDGGGARGLGALTKPSQRYRSPSRVTRRAPAGRAVASCAMSPPLGRHAAQGQTRRSAASGAFTWSARGSTPAGQTGEGTSAPAQ